MFIFYNPNPDPNRLIVGDCTIRAITKLLDSDWLTIHLELCVKSHFMYDMPSANRVWEQYLSEKGFKRHMIPDTCPDCYTVRDFCSEHQTGKYLLATGEHVVTVVDGNYYDAWDSGSEQPIYYWSK